MTELHDSRLTPSPGEKIFFLRPRCMLWPNRPHQPVGPNLVQLFTGKNIHQVYKFF